MAHYQRKQRKLSTSKFKCYIYGNLISYSQSRQLYKFVHYYTYADTSGACMLMIDLGFMTTPTVLHACA